MQSPTTRLVWLLLGLSTALATTLALFERQQASRVPVLFGSSPFTGSEAVASQHAHRVVTPLPLNHTPY